MSSSVQANKHALYSLCTVTSQEIPESAALFGPVPLQTPEPLSELAYLESAVLPSWWPQPAASGEHTGGCSYTGGFDRTLYVGPPCTGCPPVSGPPWSLAYFVRWISQVAGHPQGCLQILQWPFGERQNKAGSALRGKLIVVLLYHCRSQRSGACYQPEQNRIKKMNHEPCLQRFLTAFEYMYG